MNLGDKVVIKECYSIPELELTTYPILVLLTGDLIKTEGS